MHQFANGIRLDGFQHLGPTLLEHQTSAGIQIASSALIFVLAHELGHCIAERAPAMALIQNHGYQDAPVQWQREFVADCLAVEMLCEMIFSEAGGVGSHYALPIYSGIALFFGIVATFESDHNVRALVERRQDGRLLITPRSSSHPDTQFRLQNIFEQFGGRLLAKGYKLGPERSMTAWILSTMQNLLGVDAFPDWPRQVHRP